MKKKLYSLENHPLFASLSENQIEVLNSHASILHYSKNNYIDFENRDQAYLYGIIKGRVKVLEVDYQGNQLINDIVREGDIFGNPSLYNSLRTCYAQAAAPMTVIFTIPYNVFQSVLNRNAEFAMSYSRLLETKLQRLQNRYHNLVFKDVRSRLITFFCEWAEAEGNQFGKTIYISNYLTHLEIANLICSSRQSVTTILNKLKSQGIIQYSRYQIIISDISKLTAELPYLESIRKVS